MEFVFVNPSTQKWERHKIFVGMSLGRKNADLNLRDPMISTLHAKVEQSKSGLVLVDQGSTNKMNHQGVRVQELLLEEGLEFEIGSIKVRVEASQVLSIAGPENDSTAASSNSHWSEQFKFCLSGLEKKVLQQSQRLYPFSWQVNLYIVSGPGKGQKMSVLYGPRSFGNLDQDICLYDWAIDRASFQLVEHDGSIFLTTPSADNVRVNQLTSGTTRLKTGDKVYLGQTCIEVELLKNE